MALLFLEWSLIGFAITCLILGSNEPVDDWNWALFLFLGGPVLWIFLIIHALIGLWEKIRASTRDNNAD